MKQRAECSVLLREKEPKAEESSQNTCNEKDERAAETIVLEGTL